MRIDEKHQCLSYYKSSAPGESPAGMIDLKIVKDITPYEKCTSCFFYVPVVVTTLFSFLCV